MLIHELYPFTPPWGLSTGLAMTVYVGRWAERSWQRYTRDPEPISSPVVLQGAEQVPLCGQWAAAPAPQGTIIATYGITGDLHNQWMLAILRRKAIAQGYNVLLFDWRAHGETARRSPTLTSDGLNEGWDFLALAAQAKAQGWAAPYWFVSYSLGGQLALWAIHYATPSALATLGLDPSDIGGAAVICPNLDSNRSLSYLTQHPTGRYLERAIAATLRQTAQALASYHPGEFDLSRIANVTTIHGFDHELVIERLGFASVEDYYTASSPLPWLDRLPYPTLMLYAADDPLFSPALVPELRELAVTSPNLHLWLTAQGGHVGYISNRRCQQQWGDQDPWWAWNRVLDWLALQTGDRDITNASNLDLSGLTANYPHSERSGVAKNEASR